MFCLQADDERRLLSSLRRLCDFDAATDVVTGDLEGASPSVRVGSIDSCVDSSVIMSEVATAARTALTRGGGGEDAEDDEDLAAQSSKTNVEEEPTTPRLFTDDDASIDAGGSDRVSVVARRGRGRGGCAFVRANSLRSVDDFGFGPAADSLFFVTSSSSSLDSSLGVGTNPGGRGRQRE